MQVLFEKLDLPEKGMVELPMPHAFEIVVTAQEAQRKVRRWLTDEISLLIGADPPVLVIGQQIVWRVPAWIGFPSQGRVGTVGHIDVDVKSGEMYALQQTGEEIKQRARMLAAKLPPYKPRKAPNEFIPKHIPPAPVLNWE